MKPEHGRLRPPGAHGELLGRDWVSSDLTPIGADQRLLTSDAYVLAYGKGVVQIENGTLSASGVRRDVLETWLEAR